VNFFASVSIRALVSPSLKWVQMSRRILALFFAGWMTTAAAVPVSVRFTGTITSTNPSGPYAGVTGSFSGRLTFDTLGTDDCPAPDSGCYGFIGTPFVMGSPYGFFLRLPGVIDHRLEFRRRRL
jgi:hypothetical protein